MSNKIDLNKLATNTNTVQKESFADRVKKRVEEEKKTNTGEVNIPEDQYASMVPNRIAMMLDCSGSMCGTSNANLKQAAEEYVNSCNFADTSVALFTFGSAKEMRGGLTRYATILNILISRLDAYRDTPMHKVVTEAFDILPMTRGLLVSDGGASDWGRSSWDLEGKDIGGNGDDILDKYREAGIPIDCVHIGQSTDGEALLKRIAERTGGLFIKFKNTGNFAKAFKYLAPAQRALLGDGSMMKQLGADEVR